MNVNSVSKFSLLLLGLIVFLAGCTSREERISQYYERAEEHFEAGDLDKAKIDAKNVLQMDQTHGAARFLLYRISLDSGDNRAALKHLTTTVNNAPEFIEARVAMGNLMNIVGQGDVALEHAEAAMQLAPDNADVHSLFAAIKLGEEDIPAATEYVNQSLRLDPANLNGLRVYAAINAEEHPDKVLAAVERAIAKDPQSTDLKLLKAQLLNAAGQIEDVVALYKELVKAEPEELEHYSRLINYLLFFEQVDESEQVLSEMVASNPESLEIKLWMAEFLAKFKNDKSLAEQTLLSYIEDQPTEYAFRFALADLYVSEQRMDDSANVLKEIVALDERGPFGIEARNKMAQFYSFFDSDDEAAALWEEVLEIEPTNVQALTAIASVKLREGHYQQAISDLRRVVRDNPESMNPRVRLAQAYIASGTPDLALDVYREMLALGEGRSAIILSMAHLLLQKGSYVEAERLLLPGVEKKLINPDMANLLGTTYLQQQKWDDALELAELLESRESLFLMGQRIRGNAELGQGNLKEAIAAFETVLSAEPENNEALTGLVNAMMRQSEQNNTKSVQTLLLSHIQKHPDYAFPHELLAAIYLQEDDVESAVNSYKQAIALMPTEPRLSVALARIYIGQGDEAAALKAYSDGLEAAPESVELMMLKADMQQKLGDYAGAAAVYERVLDLQPGQKIANNNLAMLLVDQLSSSENIAKALELTRSFELERNGVLLDTRGWVLYRAGDYEQALKVLTRAVATENAHPVFHYHLGLAYIEAGDNRAARRELEKAVNTDIEYTEKVAAVQALEGLG